MTATDILRRLLDERGVKWMPVAWSPKRETFYHAANGVGFCADEYTDGVKIYTDSTITPEQAVEATLGDADATGERQRDAVEVVRCRDCKYARIMRPLDWRTGKPSTIIEEWYCEWHSNAEGASDIEPDGFCAWGETEEGEI